jgi:hypothetical protein
MNNIGLIVDGEQYTVIFNETIDMFTFTEDHVNFDELMECVSAQDTDGFRELYCITDQLQESLDVSDGDFEIRNGSIYFNGQEMHTDACDKIIEFYHAGLDYKFLMNFMTRLQKNPSKNSVDQLFRFLQHRNIAIGPDGRFWAYKTVRPDYKDKYSGRFDNSVGSVCEVPRNQVDDNPDNHCSHGFHVGSLEYAGPGGWYNSSGDRVMIVAVDPADAVSVPGDHNFQKLRVCKYEVIGEYKKPLEVVETSSISIGGKSVDPDELVQDDTVEISSNGIDYRGRVSFVGRGYLELIGEDDNGYFDEFELEFDDIDNVRYI